MNLQLDMTSLSLSTKVQIEFGAKDNDYDHHCRNDHRSPNASPQNLNDKQLETSTSCTRLLHRKFTSCIIIEWSRGWFQKYH